VGGDSPLGAGPLNTKLRRGRSASYSERPDTQKRILQGREEKDSGKKKRLHGRNCLIASSVGRHKQTNRGVQKKMSKRRDRKRGEGRATGLFPHGSEILVNGEPWQKAQDVWGGHEGDRQQPLTSWFDSPADPVAN